MGEILSRLPVTLIFVLYLASVGWNYSQLETDPANPVTQKTLQLQTAKATIEATQVKLKEMESFLRSLESKRAELQVLARQLADMKTTISDGVDTAKFVKTVVTEANRIGLKIKSLKPQGKKDAEYFSEYTFDVAFSGAFVQVIVFLDRIAGIESIVRVENIKIKRSGPSTASIVEIEGNLQLKTYRYLGSQADEIAKKSSLSTPIAVPVYNLEPASSEVKKVTAGTPISAPSAAPTEALPLVPAGATPGAPGVTGDLPSGGQDSK